jgi:deoxyribose-phosphate aldolase
MAWTQDDARRVLSAVEHTLLAADARAEQIDALCTQAAAHGFGGVCINPIFVARCRARLSAPARLVTVVGFPLGAIPSRCKALETALAVSEGADEVDMVMRIGAALDGDWAAVEEDIGAVVLAAQGRAVKVILETGWLGPAEKIRACHAAASAGAAFVKTSTGYGPSGATVEDVRLLRGAIGDRLGLKASGGIRTAAQALALLGAGADRLGTSAGPQIAAEFVASDER